eukprot:CAMPEP_0178399166 /NCGR_PEP_ID=MMETSP0689_2-20121128/15143_1 /TAXON_ID=160604 /ORGANISM="Amphidinium massartii, Strain CS-259" /LENGTH=397 /DNA_ID=CAMNT_0020019941 /DNA_START=32 /DNA_END=1225 /DNA_ORIENTATION=+
MSVTFVATSNKDLKRQKMRELNKKETLQSAFEASKPYQAIYHPSRSDDGDFTSPPKAKVKKPEGGMIVQTSPAPTGESPFHRSELGLLSVVTTAYNQHLDLTLDPNDVWVTILAQFSAYVNGGNRAEQLRDRIVDFQGKRQLTVYAAGTLFTVDFGKMAVEMVDEIAKNIKDPSLREWVLPGFSTTTTTDQVCSSVACMAILQSFFEYRFCLCCGIPEVTLRGTVDDWKLLRAKIERLAEFDLEDKLMTAWLTFLRPICDNFVLSAEGKADIEFWDQICCHLGGGSGPRYLSGWITTFSAFSPKGAWQGNSQSRSVRRRPTKSDEENNTTPGRKFPLWPEIDTNDLSHNHISVPVTIDDNGKEYEGQLFAGQFVFEEVEKHTLRPRNDWAIAVKMPA